MIVVSYRQTIRAYPNGGGSYIVARENLGRGPALTAAAGAPLVDPSTMSADAPTGMAPTMGWAAGPAGWAGGPATMAAPVPPADANPSSTVGPQLAWSNDEEPGATEDFATGYAEAAPIGETTARRIGAAGGEVVLVARTRENLERVAEDIRSDGGTAHVYPCDLSDLDAIGAMADQVLADLGRVDILINNAGRSIRRSLELSHDRMHDYQRTMQLNYFAPVQLILKFTPGMRERGFGHIINVSSIGVQTKLPRFGAYIASKSALDGLCDTLQGETVSENITFTTVHMPLVRTAMIAPTKMYDRFPTLTPEQAAATLCDAIMHRPRRLSPPSGQLTALTDALSPRPFDMVRNKVYSMFGDSAAAQTAPESAETVAAE